MVERHDAVLIEKRSEDKSNIEKLWAAAAADLFVLIKWSFPLFKTTIKLNKHQIL